MPWRSPLRHCGLKTDVLVGDNILKVVRPVARHLSCTIPQAITKYIQHLTTSVTTHQLIQRLHQLYTE